jgi:RNA polymerase sigma-70 factor (ECF subfamily)
LRARGRFRQPGDRDVVPLARSAEQRALVDRFVEALEDVYVDEVVSLLAEEARFAMPPEPVESPGRGAIGEFFGPFFSWARRLKLVATWANGQPAFGYYVWDPASSVFRANGVMGLDLREDRVACITRFGAPTCWRASNCLPCCSHEPAPEAATAPRGRDGDFAAAP